MLMNVVLPDCNADHNQHKNNGATSSSEEYEQEEYLEEPYIREKQLRNQCLFLQSMLV